MLAPLDSSANGSTTPGGSRETLISSRAPQGSVTAASPQYIDETIITLHTGAESPYRTPTTPPRSPHVQSSEYSPSVNYPQAYSPTLVSGPIITPSPTPTQRGAYPVPEEYYNNKNKVAMHSSTTDGTSQQNMYQQAPYQQSYQQSYLHHQQAYPDPVVHAYPDPALVDTPITHKKPTKPALSSTKKPKSTGRRKKIIWAMAFITIILLAVVVYLVLSMKKNKDSSSSSSSSGGRVQAPPIPPYTFEKGHCPSFFCNNYYFKTCKGECRKDSVYQTCKDGCNDEFFCTNDCEKGVACFDDCSTNLRLCDAYC